VELQHNYGIVDIYLTVCQRSPFNTVNTDSDVRTLATGDTDARFANELLLHLVELTVPFVHACI
jgi:hypothetical protein